MSFLKVVLNDLTAILKESWRFDRNLEESLRFCKTLKDFPGWLDYEPCFNFCRQEHWRKEETKMKKKAELEEPTMKDVYHNR